MNIFLIGLLTGIFTWGMTALGSSLVFLFKGYNQKVLDAMLGFAAGVMISASFFSLLIPALEMPKNNSLFIIISGFIFGALFLFSIDKITPHIHLFSNEQEGLKSDFSRAKLLVLAITIHNIPEGLAVGIAFGAYHIDGLHSTLIAAISLAVGIGIQNFPEGTSISLPLYREGNSKLKSFLYGQASALVEPIGIFIGIFLISYVQFILPFALSFAAGAMLFVVIEELIPESQRNGNTDLATLSTIFGLSIMMILDIALG